MTSAEALDLFRRRGGAVRLEGDRLLAGGPTWAVEVFREAIAEKKAELLAILRAEAAPATPPAVARAGGLRSSGRGPRGIRPRLCSGRHLGGRCDSNRATWLRWGAHVYCTVHAFKAGIIDGHGQVRRDAPAPAWFVSPPRTRVRRRCKRCDAWMLVRYRSDGKPPRKGTVCRRCQLQAGAARRARHPVVATPEPTRPRTVNARCPTCRRFAFVPRGPQARASRGGPRRKGEPAPVVPGLERADCGVNVHVRLTAFERTRALATAETLGFVGLGPFLRDLLLRALEHGQVSLVAMMQSREA